MFNSRPGYLAERKEKRLEKGIDSDTTWERILLGRGSPAGMGLTFWNLLSGAQWK